MQKLNNECAPLASLLSLLYGQSPAEERRSFKILGVWKQLVTAFGGFSSVHIIVPQKEVPVLNMLLEGHGIPNNEQGDSFRRHCPSITAVVTAYGGVWPVLFRPFLKYFIGLLVCPFDQTLNHHLPPLLNDRQPEDFLTEGHYYTWDIIRESQIYPAFATSATITEDGVCRKREDQERKRDLVPGIFVCVCRHGVSIFSKAGGELILYTGVLWFSHYERARRSQRCFLYAV